MQSSQAPLPPKTEKTACLDYPLHKTTAAKNALITFHLIYSSRRECGYLLFIKVDAGEAAALFSTSNVRGKLVLLQKKTVVSKISEERKILTHPRNIDEAWGKLLTGSAAEG